MNINSLLAKPLKFLIIAGLFLSVFLGEITGTAAEKEVDINTDKHPNGYIFKVGNLKPGDWMPRNITIFNEGIEDFKYTTILGDEKKSIKGLLEELDLLVKKDSDVLYEGKLNDFEGFTPRRLATGSSETLFFQVTMPYELGNEFQDSSAEVEILFIAESLGDPGGGDPGGGDPGGGDPGGGDPGGGDPGGEDPGGEDPGGEDPGGEDPGGEDPGGEDPGGEDPGGEDPGGEDPGGEDPGGEDPGGEDPGDEDPESEDSGDGDSAGDEDIPVDGEPEAPQTDNPDDTIAVTPEIRENILPDTATNTYTILLIGGLLVVAGSILFFLHSRRIRREH